ncbi:P-loop containing nucleoside triphosphate hydrolase protein [Lophiotrema nucula]|uniref:P-loop containing nucleoside triphosphate hydrolase protein n=1 Tax=Lophiotrema nucula TaxID=690887 RepID=A0A6A5YD76_9PLEO|nr:P-loop containing nucleoside triphosphate hydrolase protein [Lophiotrema nucula]
MRLLQRLPGGNFEPNSFDDDNPPPYAILSHTWTEGQEVTYHKLIAGEAYATKRLREEIQKRHEGHRIEQANNLYHNAVRPEIARPSCAVPFRRDLDFIDRGTLLDELQEKRSAPASRVALVGLGGVGKSQLAIEHCYRAAEQSPEMWVFWVHASNAARFEQSLRDLADSVKIEGRCDPQANIFKLVHDWLRDSKNTWLLVLDNVDDARFLLHAPASGQGQSGDKSRSVSRPLREYLPYCERGSIIVTTRNKEAAVKLVEPRDIVAVEPMDQMQAVALLEKKLGAQQATSDLAGLAATLEYMPLAIVQAAAYIAQRAPRCSVAKYLDEFRKSERKRSNLLAYNEGQLRRDWEAKNSIIVTWQISFEYIQQTRPSAADLLSLMSFFDRQGIPEPLLRRRKEQDNDERDNDERDSDAEDDTSQFSAGKEEFEHDVVTLRNFCFISVDTTGTSFEMYALVQLATRKWLTANGKLKHWKQQFISNLCAEFPTGEFENWAICQTLFAHAKSAVEQQLAEPSSQVELATVLYRAAWYAERIGNDTDAVTLAERCMKVRKKVLGQEHEDTLWSIAMVGLAYKLGGYWDHAEELFVQVIETRKKKLRVDYPNTLSSIANLALTYRN